MEQLKSESQKIDSMLSMNSRYYIYQLQPTVVEEIVAGGTTTTYIGIAANGCTLTSRLYFLYVRLYLL